jgi:hypothetical protein
VSSTATHTYERYVQLGPGVDASEEGEGLHLSGPELNATLTSSDSAPGEISLASGEKRPLSGFVFPRFREAVPRWTATFTNEAADLDTVLSFGLDPERHASAALLPGATAESLALRVQAAGTDLGTILVTRAEDELGVAVSPILEGETLPRRLPPGG